MRDYKRHLKAVQRWKPASVNLALAALDSFYIYLGLGRPVVRRETAVHRFRVAEWDSCRPPDRRVRLACDGQRYFIEPDPVIWDADPPAVELELPISIEPLIEGDPGRSIE